MGAGQAKPRPDGETASVGALMDRLGFAQAEKDKLAESVRNSDGLVKLEAEAMNLVEGKDADGGPLAEPNPERDRLRAVALLHSPAYHGFKAQIMRPLDDFYVMLKGRTGEAVRAQGVTARFWFALVLAALLATIASGLGSFAYRALVRGYGAIGAAMGGIAAGDYAAAVPGLARADEVGDMARRLEAFKQDLARAWTTRPRRRSGPACGRAGPRWTRSRPPSRRRSGASCARSRPRPGRCGRRPGR